MFLLPLQFPIPRQMTFSVSSAEVNWSLEFGPESVFLEIRKFLTEAVVNPIELPLSVWNPLKSYRPRSMEETLTGAPLTQEQQQRPDEVLEKLEVPRIQDPIRRREGQEVLVYKVSTSDSGVATMSPMATSGTDTTPTSPNIFDLAVNLYGFDYPVFDEEKRGGVDVDVSYNNDDSSIEYDDEQKTENVPPIAQTSNRRRDLFSPCPTTKKSRSTFLKT